MRGEEPEQLNPIYKKILIKRRFMYDIREVLAADSEELPAGEAQGRISAEIKYKCPPGFPVLVYGEEILAERARRPDDDLEALRGGRDVFCAH